VVTCDILPDCSVELGDVVTSFCARLSSAMRTLRMKPSVAYDAALVPV
jgi:hypothetical protein